MGPLFCIVFHLFYFPLPTKIEKLWIYGMCKQVSHTAMSPVVRGENEGRTCMVSIVSIDSCYFLFQTQSA